MLAAAALGLAIPALLARGDGDLILFLIWAAVFAIGFVYNIAKKLGKALQAPDARGSAATRRRRSGAPARDGGPAHRGPEDGRRLRDLREGEAPPAAPAGMIVWLTFQGGSLDGRRCELGIGEGQTLLLGRSPRAALAFHE